MKKESFAFRLRAWFNNLPIQDPVERRMASLLQVILIGLIVLIFFATIVLMIIPGLDTKEKLDALNGNFFGFLVVVLPLSLLRRGYFRSSVLIIITILFITPALAVTVVFDLPNSGGILIQFTLAILLSGLLVSRRALALVFGLSAALVAFSALQGQSAEPRLARLSMETAINFILFNGLIAVFLDHFGITLRTTLTDALARETELQSEITEREQAEEALSLTEKRSRALLENSWDAIALFGADGTILYGSPSTVQILGYALDEFVGRNAFELIHEDDQALITERLTLSLQQPGARIPVYARARHKNGGWRWLEGVFTNLLDEPNVKAIVNNYHDFTERKLTEETLLASEERFRLVVEAASGAMIVVDHDGKINLVNAKAQELFGYSAEELLAHPVEMLIPQRFRSGHPLHRQGFAAQPTSRPMGARRDLFGLHKDGHEVPIEIGLTPYEGSKGMFFTLALIVDITERKQAVEDIRKLNEELEQRVNERTLALKESEEQYRTLFESIDEGFCIIEMIYDEQEKPVDYRFLIVNPAFEKQTGLMDAQGKTMRWFAPNHEEYWFEIYGRIALTGEPARFENRAEQLHRWYDVYALRSGKPEKRQVAILFNDITERKQAEAEVQRLNHDLQQRQTALSEANNLLQTLMDNMPDHIYFKDRMSRFIRNSKSQAEMMGMSDPAEVIGKTDFDFFPQVHAQRSYGEEQNLIESGQPIIDIEERVVWPDGRITWVSTTKLPWRDAGGEITGMFGISRDITERKQAEEELQTSNTQLDASNKELEAFSYSVSHDLRAPLRSIDGFSQALLEDYGDQIPEPGVQYLNRVRTAAQHMAELIDDLLNLSRVTRAPMKSETVNLSALAEKIMNDLQHAEPDRRSNISIAPGLEVKGDSQLLYVVLMNLLGNAWKFTSKQEESRIEFGTEADPDETTFFVRDNGAGFDMTYADKLFGAFQRLHSMQEFPGTGVGLATVKRIITRHGGKIWAESEEGKGAAFYFTLSRESNGEPDGT